VTLSDTPSASRRFLAVLGDTSDIQAWSGIPYHFQVAGEEAGFFSGTLRLPVERLRLRRIVWNLLSVVRRERPGGFQYSNSCLEYLFRATKDQLAGAEVVSHFQLFPPLDLAGQYGVRSSYYIDMTLRRLFEEYGIQNTIGRSIARDSIMREWEGYQAARYVVCMSSWAARSVQQEYGISEDKVRVVMPGANIDDEIAEAVLSERDGREENSGENHGPFRLGFTGKHPERKGLPRLIEAAKLLRTRGVPVEVGVVGALPQQYRSEPVVRWYGYIDKRTEMRRFAETVAGFDLGCLLSYAEGLGISTLEYLRMGVPVLGTSVGGITDCVPDDAGLLIDASSSSEAIAEMIQALINEPERHLAMKRAALARRRQYTWKRVVQDFEQLWRRLP